MAALCLLFDINFNDDFCAFSALTLLVGWKEGHLACNMWWGGYLSEARYRFDYGPADATATHWVTSLFDLDNC